MPELQKHVYVSLEWDLPFLQHKQDFFSDFMTGIFWRAWSLGKYGAKYQWLTAVSENLPALILSCVDKLRNKRWMEFYPLVPVILGFNSKPVDMKGSNSNKCWCGLPTCYLHMVKCPSSVTNFHRIVMGFRSCSQGKLLLASACTVEIVLLMLGKSSTSWCGLTSYWHLFLPHVVDVQNMKIKQTKNQTKRQTVTNFCW